MFKDHCIQRDNIDMIQHCTNIRLAFQLISRPVNSRLTVTNVIIIIIIIIISLFSAVSIKMRSVKKSPLWQVSCARSNRPSSQLTAWTCSQTSQWHICLAVRHTVDLSLGRLPDPSCRRCPCRPRNSWLDQPHRDNSTPLLLISADEPSPVTRGDWWRLGGDATVLDDYALTTTTNQSMLTMNTII